MVSISIGISGHVLETMFMKLHGCSLSDISRRHNPTVNIWFLWLLWSFCPSSKMIHESKVQELCCRWKLGWEFHKCYLCAIIGWLADLIVYQIFWGGEELMHGSLEEKAATVALSVTVMTFLCTSCKVCVGGMWPFSQSIHTLLFLFIYLPFIF